MKHQSIYPPIAMTALVLSLAPSAWSEAQTPKRDARGERPTTAEELLEALCSRRPVNGVIPPRSSGNAVPVKGKLLPEGSVVLERDGKIESIDGWWTLISHDDSRLPLLPNLTLETMVRMTRASESPLSFSISGELTVFDGKNYMLVRSAPRRLHPDSQENHAENANGSAESSTDEREQTKVVSDARATDVLDVLARQDRNRPVIPTANREPSETNDRGANVFAGMLDGSAIVERPGRVSKQGDWWTILFESDRREHPEPPIRLLPCSGTQTMIDASAGAISGVVFSVSGEVTSFLGENYLLPRAVTRRFESGNLRK